MYKPNDATSITADFEHSEVYEHPFVQVLTITEKQTMPWAGNDITQSQYYGMATHGLLNYNYAGPESYVHQRVTSGTLKFEHRFSDFWSIKLGVNAFKNPENDQSVGSGAYYPYGTGNVTVPAANSASCTSFNLTGAGNLSLPDGSIGGVQTHVKNLGDFTASTLTVGASGACSAGAVCTQ